MSSTAKEPKDIRHCDLTKNPDGVQEAIERQREREKHLRVLRVDKNTVILVPKKKCTKAYAETYKEEKINKIR